MDNRHYPHAPGISQMDILKLYDFQKCLGFHWFCKTGQTFLQCSILTKLKNESKVKIKHVIDIPKLMMAADS